MAFRQRGAHERTRFSEERMVAIRREADSTLVQATAKKHKGSEQTI
jgi:hypothetical protein